MAGAVESQAIVIGVQEIPVRRLGIARAIADTRYSDLLQIADELAERYAEMDTAEQKKLAEPIYFANFLYVWAQYSLEEGAADPGEASPKFTGGNRTE